MQIAANRDGITRDTREEKQLVNKKKESRLNDFTNIKSLIE